VILTNTYNFMNAKWTALVDNPALDIDIAVVGGLQPARHLEIRLPLLDKFIRRISRREAFTGATAFRPPWNFSTCPENKLPSGLIGTKAQNPSYLFQLAAVEKWVEDHLDAWVDEHIEEETSCERLRCLIQEYYGHANPTYTSEADPRSISIMYLTLAELWAACDRCTCKMNPLLCEYDPEVTLEQLQSLALPFGSQLGRLDRLERYVKSRRSATDQSRPSLFSDFGHPKSFAVRYFDQSPKHQLLRVRVEEQAEVQRQEKLQELAHKRTQHDDLMARSDAMMCEYYEVVYDHYNNFTRQQHSYSCNKCALRKEAAQIQISVHEWPLSSNSGEAKATIFELQIPASLSNWRDATMFLMVDVFRYVRTPRRREARAHFTLRRDNVLNNYQAIPSKQRVVILSEAKPHTGSHYKLKQGASFQSEADVCVNNGLQYRYYDAICCTFMDPLQPTDHVSKKCTYQLPHRSSKLQRYLRTPGALGGLTPNSVMATLHDCPAHMSVDEYKAFGALGVGYNICYLNILAQLAMPTVDFAKVETQCLVLHTIHLAGPPLKLGSAERVTPEPVTRQRVTHGPLTNENFCRALMRELEAGLSRASENWEMWRALSTFVQLAQRVLSLNPPFDIRPRCLAYLEASRRTVLGWMETLGQRSRVATDDEQRAELCSRITEVALLCASTFDVDNANLSDVLGSPSAASALIQSSIVIQENSQATSPEHHQVYRSMMQSWRRLLFRVFPLLRRGILTGSIQDGLNVAVTASWAAFRPTGTWRGLEIPHHHWIQVQSENLDVHYNLLTAELLVRGLPLARLPEQYTGHGLYKSLFKQTSMDVMPTDEPGMAFSAKHPYAEYELSLGMDGPDMLLVAAAPTKANKFDLVPSRLFQDALPLAFTEAYLQWYDHSADQVEFRPRDSPWSAGGADIWRLRRVDSSWHLVKGQRSFVNPASRTGRALSGIFAPIETAPHVHVVYEALTNTVSVDLPRLQMEFYFDIGHSLLHSRQYRGMFIDPNQRIGSLIGLSSKLVLKHIHQADDRLVLIPEGRVTLNTVSDSVQVSIDANTTIKIHAYQIDNTLGRIVDNGSVESKLVLCHLHALTSHCLPDTLTGRTGTEAALSILRSAAVRSFTVLAPHHLELLELIAGLAPERRFYPDHLRVMQSVQWNERLCFMSQHPDFYLEVQGILEEARKARFFHPEEDGDGEPRRLAFTERDLVLRDMIRSSSFRVDGYGAEHFTTAFDQVHRERNRIGLQRGERTFIAASLVLRCRQALHSRVNAAKFQHSLRNVYFKKRTVQGPGDRLPPSTFKFDLGLLNEPSSFLPEMWCCLHSSMSKLPPRYNRFDVMIWLSTAAFAQSADMDLIQAFAAFYTLPELASITIPPVVLFKLAEGDDAPMSKVENALMPHMHPLQSCPESRMQKRDGESLVDWMRRKENRYRTNQDLVIRKFTDAIHSQWPCATPTKVAVTNADVYIDTNQAMSSIRPMFQAWHDNRRFFLYLEQVAVILERQQVSPVSVTPPREMAPRRCSSGETSSSRYFGVKDIFALNPPLPRSPSSPSSTTCEYTADSSVTYHRACAPGVLGDALFCESDFCTDDTDDISSTMWEYTVLATSSRGAQAATGGTCSLRAQDRRYRPARRALQRPRHSGI
jgi:hypothetical protein